MLTFIKLSLSDRDEYLKAFSAFPPYADLYFNNVFTWLSQKNSVYWAKYKEAIVLKFIDPFKTKSTYDYTILATDSAEIIMNYITNELGVSSFFMLPAVTVSSLSSNFLKDFSVTVDYDNSDYIYDARALAFMFGPKSKGFLRQVNYFLKNHSSEVIVTRIDLTRAIDVEKLINAVHQWDILYTHNDTDRQEFKALDFYIREAPTLRPQCLAIEIDGKIEAFSLYAYPPQQKYIIISHAKSSYCYKGLFDFLIYCTVSRSIADHTIKYVNFEQDLGIEGLRNHKQSMRPIKRLAKYTLIKNGARKEQ